MFWLVALLFGLITVLAAAFWTLRRGTLPSSGADQDVAVYKDQLAEVDRDLARGTLSAEEAETARTEVARRLLAADARAQSSDATDDPAKGRLVAFGSLAAALILGFALYAIMGAAGSPDQGLQARIAKAQQEMNNRPSQAMAESAAASQMPNLTENTPQGDLDLVARLREVVAKNPTDETGLRLLVDSEARLGRFTAAREAQEKLMGLLGDKAQPSDHTDLAEIMILAANGYVSPEAREALTISIRQNPRDGRTRYYSGLAMAQAGRPDVAFRFWNGLLLTLMA